MGRNTEGDDIFKQQLEAISKHGSYQEIVSSFLFYPLQPTQPADSREKATRN